MKKIELKPNGIYFGEASALAANLRPKSVNLVITSPPYGDVISYGKKVPVFSPDKYIPWFVELAKHISNALTDDGSFILNINDRIIKGRRSTYVFRLVCAIEDNTEMYLHERYFWHKKSGRPKSSRRRLNDTAEYIFHFVKNSQFKCFSDEIRVPYAESSLKRVKSPVQIIRSVDENGINVNKKKIMKLNPKGQMPSVFFDFNTASAVRSSSSGKHPAPFNVELPLWFIRWLTEKNDVVLDPFMGGGTTAEACILTGRKYIGFELNRTYAKFISERIELAEEKAGKKTIKPKKPKLKKQTIGQLELNLNV